MARRNLLEIPTRNRQNSVVHWRSKPRDGPLAGSPNAPARRGKPSATTARRAGDRCRPSSSSTGRTGARMTSYLQGISVSDTLQKLGFARRRLDDLQKLIASGQFASQADARAQVTQEFFFHTAGAIDVLAQLVNMRRNLELAPDRVTVGKVIEELSRRDEADPLIAVLKSLHINRTAVMPSDPYSDDGCVFRLYAHRNHVTHRYRSPFHWEPGRCPHLFLDPLNPAQGESERSAGEDLECMITVVGDRCNEALKLLSGEARG